MACRLSISPPPEAIFLLGEHDDRSSFGRLVSQRGELCRVGEGLDGDAAHRMKRRGLAVAERDGAGLVEQQCVDVAGRLDGAAGHGQHVEADEAVMPAMPMADSSAPMVVGISVTNRATSTTTGMEPPA